MSLLRPCGKARTRRLWRSSALQDACVLHFESCTYEVWRNKFLKHRHTDELATRDIPFAFYRDSISLFQSNPTGGPAEVGWAAQQPRAWATCLPPPSASSRA